MASIATDATAPAGSGNAPASIQDLATPFQALDLIREDLEKSLPGWEEPVVVVFGAESSGKSTILYKKYIGCYLRT